MFRWALLAIRRNISSQSLADWKEMCFYFHNIFRRAMDPAVWSNGLPSQIRCAASEARRSIPLRTMPAFLRAPCHIRKSLVCNCLFCCCIWWSHCPPRPWARWRCSPAIRLCNFDQTPCACSDSIAWTRDKSDQHCPAVFQSHQLPHRATLPAGKNSRSSKTFRNLFRLANATQRFSSFGKIFLAVQMPDLLRKVSRILLVRKYSTNWQLK